MVFEKFEPIPRVQVFDGIMEITGCGNNKSVDAGGGAEPAPAPVPVSSDGSHAPWSLPLLFLCFIVDTVFSMY